MKAFLGDAWQALRDLYPKGLSLFWLAPIIPALVILPEFAQHVVEVKLGMFESKDAFKALQNDPARWNVAYAKIAGLWLTILAAARFWGVRDRGGRWWDLRDIRWKPFAVGLLLFAGLGSIPMLWEGSLDATLDMGLQGLVALLTLPGLLLVFGGLFGDPMPSLRHVYVRGWPWLLLMGCLAALGFAPGAWIHQKNRQWAFGIDPAPLWAMMVWDSLLVGALAVLAGTGLALGYRGFRRASAEWR